MHAVTFRELSGNEADRLREIDRSEEIDGHYVMDNGALAYQKAPVSVQGWRPDDAGAYPDRIRETLAAGGAALGAFDGQKLVGLATLDARPVGGDPAVVALDLLYVGAGYRGRGIGKQLTALVVERARQLGATAIYISASPTRNTVDAYRRMGAQVIATPDPEKLALEPDDIHLLLPIGR